MTRTIGILALLAAFAAPALAQPTNDDWWPNRLSLEPLRLHSPGSSPLGDDFSYREAFESLDLDQVKAELAELMTTSQDWWPADFGHYGPFFIRMSWHSAGTYREMDGRGGADGGQQRFAPLNSWPDNANLDKAHRLLWPIKAKYGRAISWADLIVLAGTVAMESMGMETAGFAGGREDDWAALEVNWGPEGEWLAADRRSGDDGALDAPLGASQMGLIYVNPQGPGGNPDPQLSADAIREAFGRMAMNDEETAALIAGGHTFGKAHGAAPADGNVGVEPEGGAVEAQGFGWENSYGSGSGKDTITSGLEGAWTSSPARWTNNFLENLYRFEWEQTTSPGGAIQWIPADGAGANLVPDAHGSSRHAPIMLTTDLALKVDPIYRELTSRWLENPDEFEDAFARAWFKLTHRDLGPVSRYLGDLAPDRQFVWQDPLPAVDHPLIDARDAEALKAAILATGLDASDLVRAAWASASTFRGTDMRGGANGARVRLAPQKDWAANDPDELARVISALEGVRSGFGKPVSMADLIVLGGAAGIEVAAERGGVRVRVPFVPGRADATEEQTDVHAFGLLEPKADGFRNWFGDGAPRGPADMLVEKASLLELTIPEMAVLVGGMRALDANSGGSSHGVFTDRPGTLTNDFFVNLIDMSTEWSPGSMPGVYEGRDRASGEMKWTATPADLIFGSNSELRAVSEFYAAADSREQFVHDFVDAWAKVMTLDRFDLDQ